VSLMDDKQFRAALTGAEDVLTEQNRERARLQRMAAILYASAAILLVLALAGAVNLPTMAGVATAAGSLLVVLCGLGFGILAIRRQRKEVTRQLREMAATVDTLRELFSLVAAKQKWTPDEKDDIRRRLSRFPIGAP
jgi:ABC-type multidrug transport system fused ATPase/permease subunit